MKLKLFVLNNGDIIAGQFKENEERVIVHPVLIKYVGTYAMRQGPITAEPVAMVQSVYCKLPVDELVIQPIIAVSMVDEEGTDFVKDYQKAIGMNEKPLALVH